MLLKPWRNLSRDLKRPNQGWGDALEEFLSTAGTAVHRVLSGIQYYHDCRLAVDRDLRRQLEEVERADGIQVGVDDGEEEELMWTEEMLYPEEGLLQARANRFAQSVDLHATMAVATAKDAGIFCREAQSWDVGSEPTLSCATGGDVRQLEEWKAQMAEDIQRRNEAMMPPAWADGGDQQLGSVSQLRTTPSQASVTWQEGPAPEAALPPLELDELKDDQYRAYDIVAWHVEQTLQGKNPDPLRMIMYSEGGTGKSKVIQTITEDFRRRGAEFLLVKTAFTGTAASLIDGKTTHIIGHISVSDPEHLSSTARATLQEFWRHRKYLIIDEFSMISKTFLARLSQHVAIGKEGSADYVSRSFGGISVILCGDLHQFPPVACRKNDYLFYPAQSTDTPEERLGRVVYEEFDKVVILTEQMRITDPVWRDFLHHLRYGRVQEHHVAMLRKLIVTSPKCPETEFDQEPWISAPLVTQCHSVRVVWNDHSMQKWCEANGSRLFVVNAEDRIKGRELTSRERYALAHRSGGEKCRQGRQLSDVVYLAKGMRVMVTTNMETDLDVTNGARGEIVDIVLHPDEPPIGDSPVVHLRYMPVYVLVKLARTRATQLPGLEPGVIPVEPRPASLQIKVEEPGVSKPVQRTVRRRQFPITGAYAFTDYCSQGQTISTVIVDIATPPGGRPTLFNLYVALSRSSGRSSIRLLRDFDEKVLLQEHDPNLLAEDERLAGINGETLGWCRGVGRGFRVRP